MTKLSKKAKKKTRNQIARKKAKLQANANKPNPVVTKSDTLTPSDTAPMPTDDNGNSHSKNICQSRESNQTVTDQGSNNGSEYSHNHKPEKSYKEVAEESSDIHVTEKPPSSSFHIIRNTLNHNSEGLDDDITVDCGPLSPLTRTRLSMMVSVPGTDKGIDEEEAPLEAIRKINLMVKCLINKIPSIKLGPWLQTEKKKIKYLLELPEDIDIVENMFSITIDLYRPEVEYIVELIYFMTVKSQISRKFKVSVKDLRSQEYNLCNLPSLMLLLRYKWEH